MSKNRKRGEEPAGQGAPGSSGLDPQIRDYVARSLQAHYESIVRAPVPDRFLTLLAELEEQEKKAGEGKDDERR
ncbi:NepR family anti-sigma factor [Labrys neptuniae]